MLNLAPAGLRMGRSDQSSRRSIDGSGLLSCAAGATVIEQTLVIVLVVLVALGAFAALGGAASEKVDCAAEAIGGAGTGARPCTVDGATARAGAASRGSRAALGAAPEGDPSPPATNAARSDLGAGDAPDPGGAAAVSASASFLAGAPPPSSSTVDPEGAYAERFGDAVAALSDPARFDAVADLTGDDDRITREDLLAARNSEDEATSQAARFLLASSPAAHALDVGAGDGGVDGEISLADVQGMSSALAELDPSELRELLADTANGKGERDGQWSDYDLDALARDATVPTSIRTWAARAEPNAEHGCGLNPICHVTTAWHATDGTRSWILGAAKHAEWATSLTPPLDPREWSDWGEFRWNLARGMGEWVVGTAKGVGALAWWLVDPNSELDGETLSKLWSGVRAMPSAYWHELDTFATGDPAEAGRAGGALALDTASLFVPGGASLRGARGARSIALAEHAADPAPALGHIGGGSRWWRPWRRGGGSAAWRERMEDLFAVAPSLQRDLEAIEADGWTVELGARGSPSVTLRARKQIVLAPEDVRGNELAHTLAEELSHARGAVWPPPTPGAASRADYVERMIAADLRSEAEGELRRLEVRDEILAHGGADIGGIRSAHGSEYEHLYRDYLTHGDRERTLSEIAALTGRERTAWGTTYREYFGAMYDAHWVTAHTMEELGLHRESRVYRWLHVEHLDADRMTIAGNPQSVAHIRDVYAAEPYARKASELGPTLNVSRLPYPVPARDGSALVSIRFGDLLDAGARVYPDIGASFNTQTPMIVTVPRPVPFRVVDLPSSSENTSRAYRLLAERRPSTLTVLDIDGATELTGRYAGGRAAAPFTVDELRALQPPLAHGSFHNAEHAATTAQLVRAVADARGLSTEEAARLAGIVVRREIDPARPPRTPPRIEETIRHLEDDFYLRQPLVDGAESSFLRERAGVVTERELHLEEAIDRRAARPRTAKELDSYHRALSRVAHDDRERAMYWGAMTAELDEMSVALTLDFEDALGRYGALARERGLGSALDLHPADALSRASTPERFAADVAHARDAFGIELRFPTRRELLEMLPPQYERRFEANRAAFQRYEEVARTSSPEAAREAADELFRRILGRYVPAR